MTAVREDERVLVTAVRAMIETHFHTQATTNFPNSTASKTKIAEVLDRPFMIGELLAV